MRTCKGKRKNRKLNPNGTGRIWPVSIGPDNSLIFPLTGRCTVSMSERNEPMVRSRLHFLFELPKSGFQKHISRLRSATRIRPMLLLRIRKRAASEVRVPISEAYSVVLSPPPAKRSTYYPHGPVHYGRPKLALHTRDQGSREHAHCPCHIIYDKRT